jgi:hypothetical protein
VSTINGIFIASSSACVTFLQEGVIVWFRNFALRFGLKEKKNGGGGAGPWGVIFYLFFEKKMKMSDGVEGSEDPHRRQWNFIMKKFYRF